MVPEPEPTSAPTARAVRRPRVGDRVMYEGGPATVTRVYPEGASYVPGHLKQPVDLDVQRGHLTFTSTMTPHGPSSGWSWPADSPAADPNRPEGAPRDEA